MEDGKPKRVLRLSAVKFQKTQVEIRGKKLILSFYFNSLYL